MTHSNSTLTQDTIVPAAHPALTNHTNVARVVAGGMFLAGGLLSVVHSLNGAVGMAVLVAIIAGVLGGVVITRPEVGYAAGAGLAAAASFMGGFAFVGLIALAYCAMVAARARRRTHRVIDLTAVS